MFSTSSVATILQSILTDAGSILTSNLPTIFTFSLAVAATFFVYRWVKGHVTGRGVSANYDMGSWSRARAYAKRYYR